MDKPVLVIASKIKSYVKESHNLRCSDDIMEVLSETIRDLLDRAATQCQEAQMQTLKARHFPRISLDDPAEE